MAKIYELTGIQRSESRVRVFSQKHRHRVPESRTYTQLEPMLRLRRPLKKELQPHLDEASAGLRDVFFLDAAHLS